jgi:type IV pilus assembly protein PilY1
LEVAVTKTKTAGRMLLIGLSSFFIIAGTSHAVDTDVLHSGQINVPPNVLILFDTSGSMADKMTIVTAPGPTTPYIPTTAYTGTYSRYQVYYQSGTQWLTLPRDSTGTPCVYSPTTNISCGSAMTSLLTTGWWLGYLDVKDKKGKVIYSYACTSPGASNGVNEQKRIATGNYLNYLATPTTAITNKIDVAKEALCELIDSVDESAVRFGLMRFNGVGTTVKYGFYERNLGGYMLAKCGSSHQTIKDAVNAIPIWCFVTNCGSQSQYPINPYTGDISATAPTSSGNTPLAESLAEAGLYFAGKSTFFNPPGWVGYPGNGNDFGVNGVYTSPIQWRCQKNYVLVITDGMPYNDHGNDINGVNLFTQPDYINGKSIAHYYPDGNRDIDRDGDVIDTDTHAYVGETWMGDVAKFLYEEDIINSDSFDQPQGGSFNQPEFRNQRIQTYAISFLDASALDFLRDVTDGSHGRGKVIMATDKTSMVDALAQIVGNIIENSGNFISPVVPVNKQNKVYSGNSVYVGLFSTDDTCFWKGNLKKFGYGPTGTILDRSGNTADFVNSLNISSCWGVADSDGLAVSKGGAGKQLLSQATRNCYTFDTQVAGNPTALTNSANAFSATNALITSTVLDITSGSQTKDDLISFIRADGDYLPNTGVKKRDWTLGAVLHSRPTVMRAGTKNYIFVGANDGFLHCFEDEEGDTYDNLTDDVLTEKWAFVPWELMPKLRTLQVCAAHQYFVDGMSSLYTAGNYKYLTFGLRRGGYTYTTLKVGQCGTNGNTYIDPAFAWQIPRNILTTPLLGESWGEPHFCKLKNGSFGANAIILPGGYDSGNQDTETPFATGDTSGMAVYAVDAGSGSLLSSLLKFTNTTTNMSTMIWSIVDLMCFDSDGDGYTDKIYAGDMGGQLFAMRGYANGAQWTGRKLLQSGGINPEEQGLKFFCAPDAAMQGFQYKDGANIERYSVWDYVYAGTGDREHPNLTTKENRFYAVRNKDDGVVVTETNPKFRDVTYYSTGYADPHGIGYLKSSDCQGWFIRLGYEFGEHRRIGEKVVSSPLVFGGIVYFTTFMPGTSAGGGDMCVVADAGEGFLYGVDYLTGEAVKELGFNLTADQRSGAALLNESNRRVSLGAGMPTPPKLTVTRNGPVLIVGTKTVPVPFKQSVTEFFWLK